MKKNYVALKKSVAITPSTNFDLAIECLGVCVATIVVKMMKRKFATSEFSSFGCAIPGLLSMLHRMVFAVLSRSSKFWRSVVLVLFFTIYIYIHIYMSRCSVTWCRVEKQQIHEKKNKWMSRPHQVIGRGPWCTIVVHVFRIVFIGAHTDHMDDYDECEWSLCCPCTLFLPLLHWYTSDLSLRCRR